MQARCSEQAESIKCHFLNSLVACHGRDAQEIQAAVIACMAILLPICWCISVNVANQ